MDKPHKECMPYVQKLLVQKLPELISGAKSQDNSSALQGVVNWRENTRGADVAFLNLVTSISLKSHQAIICAL